jgi:hypothetical protein
VFPKDTITYIFCCRSRQNSLKNNVEDTCIAE